MDEYVAVFNRLGTNTQLSTTVKTAITDVRSQVVLVGGACLPAYLSDRLLGYWRH